MSDLRCPFCRTRNSPFWKNHSCAWLCMCRTRSCRSVVQESNFLCRCQLCRSRSSRKLPHSVVMKFTDAAKQSTSLIYIWMCLKRWHKAQFLWV
jgi:hypothetical protein